MHGVNHGACEPYEEFIFLDLHQDTNLVNIKCVLRCDIAK